RLHARRLPGAHVLAPGAMTALAVDALRKVPHEDRRAVGGLVSGRNLGIPVMAEQALVGSQAPRRRMTGIESRIHPPISAPFRIPAERQFYQCPAGRTMQIRSRVVARAE